MFTLFQTHMTRKTAVMTFATVEAAKAHAVELFGEIVFFEEDPDNKGFFDMFTKNGAVLAIEPAE